MIAGISKAVNLIMLGLCFGSTQFFLADESHPETEAIEVMKEAAKQ